MKVIRWLLSNIVLIVFVLALTYAYVYWDDLTGEDTPAGKFIAYLSTEYEEVSEFLDEYGLIGDEAADATATGPAPEAVETATVPQVALPPRQQMQPAPQPVPPQAMLQPSVRQPVPVPAERQEPAMRSATRAPFPGQAMMQQAPAGPRMPPRREPMPEPMPMPGDQAGAVEQPASTTRELWISAREAYHSGNIDASVRNYRDVIAKSTDNYDAYGELGNVYLSRGSYTEAADAYFQAAAILVRKGEVRRARSLLPMLGRLDRAKAQELNQLINDATS